MSSSSDKDRDIDSVTGTATTGHEWDGITELDTPMPRWWLYTFYATILWGIGYFVLYPSWPIFKDGELTYMKGTLGYSQRAIVGEEMKAAAKDRQAYYDKIASLTFEDIQADSKLMEFVVAGGKAAFGDNCAPCHGTGGQGAAGFPNLNDDDWLWGGDVDSIYTSIQHGVRWEIDEETRFSEMPRFLEDDLLSRDQILDVVEHVYGMTSDSVDSERSSRGASVYADNCASCHGESGAGDRSQGAPNLTDALWLYGGERADIYATVSRSRRGVMPAWAGRLDNATIKQLALYVHGLGGGEATKPEAGR